MGTYTDHWARYKKNSTRELLKALLLIGVGLPGLALVGYGLSQVTEYAVPLQVALLVLWLVALTRLLLHQSKVPCPRCGETYSRGKYLSNCPKCGLRMLQEDPRAADCGGEG
ncbi:MAG: hypothetical protein IPF94_11085 [Betaproteobacteria bacterium]|nr:hypothetical protein [Betaproteobacteria bacterium]